MDNASKKSLIKFAAYLVIFAAIVLFLLNPSLSEINKNKNAIADGQNQLNANYDEIASLQKISKDKENFEAIKNTVLGYIPPTLDSSEFIVEVEGLAKKTDLTIDSVSMNAASSAVNPPKEAAKSTDTEGESTTTVKKKSASGTQQNEFSLSTKTDFSKAMSFLGQMEKLSRFNSISSISIASVEQGSVDIKITGNIYYEQ